MPDGQTVRQMFARVADRYDRANHFLSVGIDRLWRRRAVRFSRLVPGERVLDTCSGTGDLAFALARAGGEVVGSDFCGEMLVHASRKRAPFAARGRRAPDFLLADTQQLPFPSASFDLATVAFGIRNVADPVVGLREMGRVLRPGGRVLVLEFCKPRLPVLRQAYMIYFRRVLPRLGRWISGDRDGAYDYLPNSVMAFPEREEFLALMERAGLVKPQMQLLSGGIAALYLAERPADAPVAEDSPEDQSRASRAEGQPAAP